MKSALVVGGTAATGPHVVQELLRLGYEPTIYHRGRHEIDALSDYEHIHGEPHFADSINADLAGRVWDVVVASYGRTRLLAAALRGRTGQFVSIGGLPVLAPSPVVPQSERQPYRELVGDSPRARLTARMIETEKELLAMPDTSATVLRYPYVYGPHAVVVQEWRVLQRALDGRRRWLCPGGGLSIWSRCAAPNAARAVAVILGEPVRASGQVFHAADATQWTFREWVRLIAEHIGIEFEFVDLPWSMVRAGSTSYPAAYGLSDSHQLTTADKLRVLGYSDVVEPSAWLATTIDYYLAHPPPIGLDDAYLPAADFDYQAEDALLGWWDAVTSSGPPDVGATAPTLHAYPHPKQDPAR
jgi:nucleoside-diphosphate-sugar epimerase